MHERIHAYLRVAASSGRDTEHIGPFLATFSYHSANPYLNYAIPDDGATPSPAQVQSLIDAYSQRGRVPRLEYIAQLAPAVEECLLTAGFMTEGRLPLMTCRPGHVHALPVPPDIELVVPQADDELYGMLAAQNEAYGEGEPKPAAVQRLRVAITQGQIAVLARDTHTGTAVGGGICSIPHDGLTEVAAIGVRSAYRRRGIAGALSARLLQEAFNVGVTLPWLMADTDADARNFARAGFVPAGEMLHIALRHRGRETAA